MGTTSGISCRNILSHHAARNIVSRNPVFVLSVLALFEIPGLHRAEY